MTINSTMPDGSRQRRDDAAPAAWSAVYAMSLCSFALVASEFMPVSLLSPIAADLHLTEGQAGQTIAISGLFAVLTSLSISKLTARFDRRFVLLGLAAMLIVSGTIAALAPSFAVLLIARAAVGVAIGGFWSMSGAIAMRLVPANSVGKALAVLQVGPALASALAAPLGSLMGGVIGWRGAFFSMVPIALVALLWQLTTLPAMPAQVRQDNGGRMIALLRRMPVLFGMASVGVLFAGQFALYTYMRPFLEQVTHLGLGMVSTMLLVVGLSGFLGTLFIGRFLDQRLYSTLTVLPAIMAAVAFALAAFGNSVAIVAVLLVFWGFAATTAPVGWWAWLTRAAPDDAEAGGGMMVAVAQIAITLGATVGGIAFDNLGAVPEFTISGAILVLATAAAFGIGRIAQRAGAGNAAT
ncbi:MFS transporter [Paraburkholderia sp. EG286B]|uniref:MFS transporter n=1 Tax=Paraburkholderia sp. EG286B TaxID=3237011 RepID=UPI0034D1FFE8